MGGCPFNFLLIFLISFNFDGCLDVIDIGTTKKGAHRDFQVLDNPPFLTAVKDAGVSNNRRRKALNYQTPAKIMQEHLLKIAA